MTHRCSPSDSHRGPSAWIRTLSFLVLLVGLPLLASAQSREYRVKAAFLFNFAKFVEGPADTHPEEEALRVGIWAPEAPFAVMAEALSDQEVAGRPLLVYRYSLETDPPHILFVPENSEPIPSALLRKLAAAHVLVIGESPDFAARYGIIGLVPRDDQLRFQVNVGAAKRAGLVLSGQLARLAEIVRDES
ncbi:MAG: YfiR family protein [Candidatus Synoicihabitans palmerolidicus]|nr:YfiR family protein [Candidatus Synoicihabitans palmerolidicus]